MVGETEIGTRSSARITTNIPAFIYAQHNGTRGRWRVNRQLARPWRRYKTDMKVVMVPFIGHNCVATRLTNKAYIFQHLSNSDVIRYGCSNYNFVKLALRSSSVGGVIECQYLTND